MKQTICVNSTPGDATAAANVVAESIRATGKVVTIGTEYSQPYGHKAGMLAVDLTIEDAPPPTITRIDVTEAIVALADGMTAAAETVLAAETIADVPFADGPDLSQGPDATDDEGHLIGYREEKRARKAKA